LGIYYGLDSDEGVARLVGGICGGMIGSAIAYARIDWATPYGLTTGIFFGTLLAGHVSNPTRQTSVFSLVASTLLLLFALGVFHDTFFMQLDGEAFVISALAAALWLSLMGAARMLAMLKLRNGRQ